MKKAAFISTLALSLLATATNVGASTTDCQNLYIGRIWLEKTYGLFGVVFLNNPGDPSGSYWTYFNNWTVEDKKAAFALLTTAKLTQHRVHVTTEEADGCGIQTGNRMVKSLYLANEP
jgi:hypothetical protein